MPRDYPSIISIQMENVLSNIRFFKQQNNISGQNYFKVKGLPSNLQNVGVWLQTIKRVNSIGTELWKSTNDDRHLRPSYLQLTKKNTWMATNKRRNRNYLTGFDWNPTYQAKPLDFFYNWALSKIVQKINVHRSDSVNNTSAPPILTTPH